MKLQFSFLSNQTSITNHFCFCIELKFRCDLKLLHKCNKNWLDDLPLELQPMEKKQFIFKMLNFSFRNGISIYTHVYFHFYLGICLYCMIFNKEACFSFWRKQHIQGQSDQNYSQEQNDRNNLMVISSWPEFLRIPPFL